MSLGIKLLLQSKLLIGSPGVLIPLYLHSQSSVYMLQTIQSLASITAVIYYLKT